MPIEVIDHKINRGLGETARDLFERAAEICAPQDIIVRMDCDNTRPDVMKSMIAKLEEATMW
jgi:dolichol-phosphate mannosyltransferase